MKKLFFGQLQTLEIKRRNFSGDGELPYFKRIKLHKLGIFHLRPKNLEILSNQCRVCGNRL